MCPIGINLDACLSWLESERDFSRVVTSILEPNDGVQGWEKSGLIVLRSVDSNARPVGSVVPVDAVAVCGDGSSDTVPIPVGRQVPSCVHLAACVVTGLIAELQVLSPLLDGAGLGAIPLGIPCPGQVQTVTPSPATGVASRPERAVRPVDLAAVRAEGAVHELPSWRDDAVLPLKLSRGGTPALIGQGKKGPVIADRGMLRGISLDAPRASKGRSLLVWRKLSLGFLHA